MLCLDNNYHFFPLFVFPPSSLLHWIEKRSSHGCLLEHLESSFTKIIIGGPIVRHLCVGRYRETKILKMNFTRGSHLGSFCTAGICEISCLDGFLCCWFTTLAKYSRHDRSLFVLISAKKLPMWVLAEL